ncbi:TKL protein kinase [Saprolegnia diclina VS20]|uniref:TKL protein kinase n=1 Tax=Saprolegnia diclina (strain VS20) TaxID=1156394 RepID=T0RYV8_SAPDV|nr:TKL protein kinase [Saprolegnia diclina VS20]EQC35457.1 TKL protein kinase [Saprolegnia diclina VS20]|eukprot:XP_008611207.1 TKL protein kinase [Saprolegnia diclina VS20]
MGPFNNSDALEDGRGNSSIDLVMPSLPSNLACIFAGFASTFTCDRRFCPTDNCCLVDDACRLLQTYPSPPTFVNATIELLHSLPPVASVTFHGNGLRQIGLATDAAAMTSSPTTSMWVRANPQVNGTVLLPATMTDVYFADLTDDPHRSFVWPKALRSLSMDDAAFAVDTPLPASLESFHCSNCGWSRVRHSYEWPPALKHLTLRRNRMQSFTAKHSWPSTLQTLDVSSNLIELFEGLPVVKSLNMRQNRLRSIHLSVHMWADNLDFSSNPYLESVQCAQLPHPFSFLNLTNSSYATLSLDKSCVKALGLAADKSAAEFVVVPKSYLNGKPSCPFGCSASLTVTIDAEPSAIAVCNMTDVLTTQLWIGIYIAESVLVVLAIVVFALRLTRSFCFALTTTNTSTHDGIELEFIPALLSDDEIRRLLPLEPYRLRAPLTLYPRSILGRGATSDVVLGSYHAQYVAVKQIRRDLVSSEMVCAFVDEIRLMARFSCPYLVSFVGVQWSTFLHLQCVVEHMAHGDLRSYLETHRTLPADAQWRMALAVAQALVYLHAHSVVHRDVKSRNVLLGENLQAKVADFGVARRVASKDDEVMTSAVGTFRWTAPEVLQGARYDTKADIYSFGMVLTELDSRKVPYADVRNGRGQAMGSFTLLYHVMRGEMQPSFSSACPEWLKDVALRCVALNPDKRPTAREVVQALEDANIFTILNDDDDADTSSESSIAH